MVRFVIVLFIIYTLLCPRSATDTRTGFDYWCLSTNHMSVTIKTEHLHKIFRTVRNNNDDVSLIADDEHIKVNIQRNDCNGANHRTVYEYTIAQMVVMNHERIIIDERNYACEVLMPTKLLADIICHNLKDMGERLRLSVSADCVTFEGLSHHYLL